MKWALVGLIVACNACSDLLNASGMRRHGEVRDFRPQALARLLAGIARNPRVLLGIVALAVAFFALMALLSIAKLSFAIPATAASYVVETLLAKYLLHEKINRKRWLGALLVASGVALLAQ
ncbi:MAG TPA: EamA family transporter [Bryobacteraceae bacterium]|nr:EamA family transporter [Bryobacteraceae bacterium]